MSNRNRKNLITMISLLLFLLIVSGFYVWFSNRDKSGKNDTADSDSSFVIAALDPDLIDTIYYKNENADITLVLEDDTWVYTEEKERPINKYYVSYLINIIDSIRAERVVNENPEDLSLYGLDSPKAIIKGSQPDGKTVALMIGEKTTAGDGRYVKLENDDTVYLVKRIPETHSS